ncbi:TPA: amidohydrolase [bacterium]|nr:amidohydrolase [bacterium]
MIIDSHTHAWEIWPYQPQVPDEKSRGIVEQLLYEMDQCGVNVAILVCAQIDKNPNNNDYVYDCVRKYPDRLLQFADIDCSWSKTYHTAGADDRLMKASVKYSLKGYTHYLRYNDDCSWFFSDDGRKFFEATEKLGLVAGIAMSPHQQAPLRKLAQQFPAIPFLCHHFSGIKANEQLPYPLLREVLSSAKVPNIYIKVSGFGYVSEMDYPYKDTEWIVKAIYEHFGSSRLCWGSDYPVVRNYMTYRQSLEVFRTHCTFIPEFDKTEILGVTLHRLLTE